MNSLLCNACGQHLPLSQFHRASTTTRGYQYKCKQCVSKADSTETRKAYQRAKVKKWRAANPDKRAEQKARHYERNKAKVDQKAKDWYNNNRDRYRDNAFRRKYGISLAEYDVYRHQQDYCCAICGVSELDTGKKMVVDHNHNTGAVRKLLCAQCNVGLGMFKDRPDILEKAACYLRLTNG